MMQLAMVLDEMGLDETNTIIVTGIGCTGRMGGYMKYETVYTLHGRTLPVAEAIKTVRPEMHVIVVAGDGDTASIGGNHLIHAIRRNAHLTVLCNNNEIYGLTGGQTGPTTPTGTKTLSSPARQPEHADQPAGPRPLLAARAVRQDDRLSPAAHAQRDPARRSSTTGFSFVDITSQCIENNGRRIGFASANDMLTFYRKTYKRAAKGAEHLNPSRSASSIPQTDGAADDQRQRRRHDGRPERPAALPEQPAGPMTATGRGRVRPRAAPAGDDEKARKRRRVAGARGADGAALAGGQAAGRQEGADPGRGADRGRPGRAGVAAHRGERARPAHRSPPGEVEISADRRRYRVRRQRARAQKARRWPSRNSVGRAR